MSSLEPEIPVELSPISEEDKNDVNPKIVDLRKSINVALDYLTKLDKSSVFAVPVSVSTFTILNIDISIIIPIFISMIVFVLMIGYFTGLYRYYKKST